jgi:hypothetical protein
MSKRHARTGGSLRGKLGEVFGFGDEEFGDGYSGMLTYSGSEDVMTAVLVVMLVLVGEWRRIQEPAGSIKMFISEVVNLRIGYRFNHFNFTTTTCPAAPRDSSESPVNLKIRRMRLMNRKKSSDFPLKRKLYVSPCHGDGGTDANRHF